MFSAKLIHQKGFETIELKDTRTGTVARIIPSCGAILHAFNVVHKGEILKVIDSYTDYNDFRHNVTTKGFKSCKLSPFACRIDNAQYQIEGKEYTIEKFLLNGSALHGLLYDAAFIITDTFANEENAGVHLQYQYKGNDKGYPFHYDCEITYTLKKENALTLSTTIINKDSRPAPVQDGWHPYFTLEEKIDDLDLAFQSTGILEFSEELIPTGKIIPYREFSSLKKIEGTVFDNCFTLDPEGSLPICVLRNSDKKIQIEIYPDKNYPYLQIYTPGHRYSIAIENLSAAPDAFNNGMGLIILEPGASKEFITNYKIRELG